MQLHGTPGGYDQSLALGSPFLAAGMGSICVSRPGYLRTPIEAGRTPAQQADAFAGLLDTLEIERVAVQGVSGGGPSAIEFVTRHPERISVLFLTCAVSGAYPIDIPAWSKVMMSPLGMRLSTWMIRRFPRSTIRQLIAEESTYSAEQVNQVTDRIMSDPGLIEFLEGMTQSGTPWEDRQAGFDCDIEAIRHLEEQPLPLEQIKCPTLIVHGTADDDVPYSVALQAHERINDSQLHTMEDACHLLWIDPGAEVMQRRQVSFLQEHT